MGLQGSLDDCSSESILILSITYIATTIRYLRSLTRPEPVHKDLMYRIGSGLAGLVVLAEQLNLNRTFSYRYGHKDESDGSKCLVCLSKMREGEEVRKLACCHMYHRGCLDGWLGQLSFSCPICRSRLVEDRSMEMTRWRLGHDVLNFFSL